MGTLKEKVLIEEFASHLISDIVGVVLAESGVWSIKLDDTMTFIENEDVSVDRNGDQWVKSGTIIIPLKGIEEEIFVSTSLSKDQLDDIYDLLGEEGVLKV